MTSTNNRQDMETIYTYRWSSSSEELMAQLEKNLNPRSSEMLYDVVAGLGVNKVTLLSSPLYPLLLQEDIAWLLQRCIQRTS